MRFAGIRLLALLIIHSRWNSARLSFVGFRPQCEPEKVPSLSKLRKNRHPAPFLRWQIAPGSAPRPAQAAQANPTSHRAEDRGSCEKFGEYLLRLSYVQASCFRDCWRRDGALFTTWEFEMANSKSEGNAERERLCRAGSPESSDCFAASQSCRNNLYAKRLCRASSPESSD